MDAIAPALIGLGLWFAYHAWTNPDPHPIEGIYKALGGSFTGTGSASSPLTPSAGSVTTPATTSAGTTAAVAASGFNNDVP